MRPQLEALRRGFGVVVPDEPRLRIQRMVSPAELEMLLCGIEKLDVAEWKRQSRKREGIPNELWERFWSVVGLLEFVTGISTLPVGGFAALPGYGGPDAVSPFTVAPPRGNAQAAGAAGAPQRRLGVPTAATCFNTLYLPAYPGEAEMRAGLLEALANRGNGFNEAAVAH